MSPYLLAIAIHDFPSLPGPDNVTVWAPQVPSSPSPSLFTSQLHSFVRLILRQDLETSVRLTGRGKIVDAKHTIFILLQPSEYARIASMNKTLIVPIV